MDPLDRLERDGYITFPDCTTWKIGERLSEEAYQTETYPYESRTVYQCTKVGDAGVKAAIKVKKQYYYLAQRLLEMADN